MQPDIAIPLSWDKMCRGKHYTQLSFGNEFLVMAAKMK
jgi:hypothetical protein